MEEGPKCPNCGRTLSYLKRVCSESIEYELSEDGCYERAENSKEECTGFVCPYCGYVIANSETEALRFLRQQTSEK